MSLHYIIDGYNIINHPKFCRNLKQSPPISPLVSLIKTKRLCGSLKNKITIVCDGYPLKEENLLDYSGYVDMIFSRQETADERIRKLIEGSKNRKDIVVVSDDKEIIVFAKHHRANTLDVETFLSRNSPQNISKDEFKELGYSEIYKINQELKKLWLK